MTAWEELRSGVLGEEFARLLYRCARAAGRARNFPPPAGHQSWDAAAAIETGHEFLTSTNIRRRLTEMALLADNDDELRRVLTQALINHLREQGRATTMGRLIRRIKDVLRANADFTEVPPGQPGAGYVALAAWPSSEPFGGREQDLVRAAFAVREVTLVRWSPQTRRESPVADRESIERVAAAILTAAAGSLTWSDLAAVIARRFGVAPGRSPATVSIDTLDSRRRPADDDPEPAAQHATAPSVELLLLEAAAEVLDQLTLRERLVLAWLGETVRTIADRTGLPVSTAGVIKQRVTDRLSTMLADHEDAEAVALAARDLAAHQLGIDIT
ncbi:MAG TPA: hypothetical protein VNU26_16335 [Mycobacteriales bacterium]|nr:hypothetical protein [Mycobacteriales bacterium]